MGKRFCASAALLVSAFMILAFVPVIADEDVTYFYLTTSVIPPGSGTISPASGFYPEGTFVTITATPAHGYEFDYWSCDLTSVVGEARYDGYWTVTIRMDSDMSVTANCTLPDFVVYDINFSPVDALEGQSSIKIWGKVKSLGTYGPLCHTGGAFHIYFYLSRDTNITSSDRLIGKLFLEKKWDGIFSFTHHTDLIPKGVIGSYYVGAIVDATGVIHERNEGNNTACAPKPLEIAPSEEEDEKEEEKATLTDVYGDVKVIRDGEFIPIEKLDFLRCGDTIRTGMEYGFTRFVFLDGSEISLRGATWTILRETAMELLEGQIHAKLTGKKQKEFKTPYLVV